MKKMHKKTVFLFGLLLAPLDAAYTDPKQVLLVNGKKLKDKNWSFLKQVDGGTQSLYDVFLTEKVSDDVIISQVDTVVLNKDIVIEKNIAIVGGNGGSGGDSICSSGGGGGGGATFGHRTGVALGGVGPSAQINPLVVGAGGLTSSQGANGGNGGNGGGGGGGAAAIGFHQSCGAGQGGGNIIGGGGGGAAATNLDAIFIFAGTSAGMQGNIKSLPGRNGENGMSAQKNFGGSGFCMIRSQIHIAGGGAAEIELSPLGSDFYVETMPGAPGSVIKNAMADNPQKTILGGKGGGGDGTKTFTDILTTQMGYGGVGGGGGAAGELPLGSSGQPRIRVGATLYSSGSGGASQQGLVFNNSGQGVDGVSFGSGGSGFGLTGMAIAGGGAGGGFGVGGGGAGLGFDRSSLSISCALAGGGGGGFGAFGGQGWSSSSTGSGSGGDGGQISIKNERVPPTFSQECCYGLSGGNGGNGYSGGGGGDAGGTFTVSKSRSLTIKNGSSLTIFGGEAGEDGIGAFPGQAGAGGGILNIGDPILGNGTVIVEKGSSINIYAPRTVSPSSASNGGGINIFSNGTLQLEGTLGLFGYVQTLNQGQLIFGDYSIVSIDYHRLIDYKNNLFSMNAPKAIATIKPVEDAEEGIGSITANKWIIQSTVQDSNDGQTARFLDFNRFVKHISLETGSYLFSTTSFPLRLSLDKTLMLNPGSSFMIEEHTVIFGNMVVDKGANISAQNNELHIFGTLSTNAENFDSYSIDWLDIGAKFVTTENFVANSIFTNRDFTWSLLGRVNSAFSLPKYVDVSSLATLNYFALNDESVHFSGLGYFNHRGKANLTISGSAPFIKSFSGNIIINKDLSGNTIEMNGGVLKILGPEDVQNTAISIKNEIKQKDGNIILSGNVFFESTITLENEASFSISKGTHVTMGNHGHLKIINGSVFDDASVNGGKITLGKGIYYFNSSEVSNLQQTQACFIMTEKNTFDSYTMGIAGQADDTYNALLMMPGSKLDVSGLLTLNNKTVLIVGYDASRAQESKVNLISGSLFDRYDHIFALGVDQGKSTGILTPIDASVDILGSHYRFEILENASGVVFQMIKNDSVEIGSNSDLVIYEILDKNTYLKSFLKYDAYKSSYSYRLSLINGGNLDLPDETLELGPTEGLGSDPSPDFYVSKVEEVPKYAFLRNPDGTETAFEVDEYGNIRDQDGNIIDDFYNIHGKAIIKKGKYSFPFGLLVDVGDELIFEPGSISKGKTITMRNGRMIIQGGNHADKVTIENDLNLTFGELTISGYVKLGGNTNIGKEVITNISNSNIEQDQSSKISMQGNHRFSNVQLEGGDISLKNGIYALENVNFQSNVIQDPALFILTGKNTFDSYTMGIAGQADDTYNALLMMPGSKLDVSGLLTLNNKTVLIVGYDPNNIENISKEFLTFGSVVTSNNDTSFFDHILLLNVVDGQSGGLLFPVDATINIDDIHYGFNISKTDKGFTIDILRDVEPSAGSNIDSVINDLLSLNAALKEYVKFNATASSFGIREIQVEEGAGSGLANALIAAVNMMNGSKMKTMIGRSDYRLKGFASQPTKTRLENIIKCIENEGPIVIQNDAGKAWVSPYTSYSNTKGKSSSTQWIGGLLFGIEYNLNQLPASIGFLGGGYLSGLKQKNKRMTTENAEGLNIGFYGSYSIWHGGRVDYLYSHTLSTVDRCDTYGQMQIKHRYKTNDDVFDAQISHIVKWANEIWSVRFNLGYTYHRTMSNISNLDMKKLPLNSLRKHSSKAGEAYSGIGLRWNMITELVRLRLTGIYEYGISTHRSENYLTYMISGTRSLSVPLSKKSTHYLTCYGTLDIKQSWIFVAGVQSSLSKNTVDVGCYVKAIYKF